MSEQNNSPSLKGRKKPPGEGSMYHGAGSHIKHSIEDLLPALVVSACNIFDYDRGLEHLHKVAKDAFFAKFGASMRTIEIRLEQLEREKKVALDDLDTDRSKKPDTPELLPAAKVNSVKAEKQIEEVRFHDWQIRDRIEVAILLPLLFGVLGASAVTAHANLVGTGLPVFLENPTFAWTTSATAAAAALSVKLVNSMFRTDKAHRLFTSVLNGMAIGFSAAWVLLFSDQFHGVSSDVVGGDLFAEPNAWDQFKQTAFVAVTLLTEVSIGAVLANRIDQILRAYSPRYWYENIERKFLDRDIQIGLETVAQQTEADALLKGQLAEYQHSLNLQIDLATLAYEARRARFDESNF